MELYTGRHECAENATRIGVKNRQEIAERVPRKFLSVAVEVGVLSELLNADAVKIGTKIGGSCVDVRSCAVGTDDICLDE